MTQTGATVAPVELYFGLYVLEKTVLPLLSYFTLRTLVRVLSVNTIVKKYARVQAKYDRMRRREL